MFVKVCGMREPDNVKQVALLSVDMMGFIFYPKSPRYASHVVARSTLHSTDLNSLRPTTSNTSA